VIRVCSVTDVPKGERLIVDAVQFNPNPVTSRSVPIQVRTSRDRDGVAMVASTVSTAFGVSGLAGPRARFASSFVNAQ